MLDPRRGSSRREPIDRLVLHLNGRLPHVTSLIRVQHGWRARTLSSKTLSVSAFSCSRMKLFSSRRLVTVRTMCAHSEDMVLHSEDSFQKLVLTATRVHSSDTRVQG